MNMMKRQIGALLSAAILAGCASGDVGVQPGITPVDPIANSKLQFAVGVATINETSQNRIFYGLNTVETLRQPNGLSAVLDDTPYITGPPGFVGQKDPITGNPTTILSGSGPGIACNATTFGCAGGAFGYGFAPDNTLPGSQNVSFSLFLIPMAVGSSDQITTAGYYSGPPAFPQFNNGTYPAGFQGYSPGFVDFQSAPVVGSYRLDVVIPTGPTTSGTISATAQLNSITGLPVIQTPVPFPDPNGDGGLKVDIIVPAGISETWVWIQDQGGACHPPVQGNSTGTQYYTIEMAQTGPQQLTLPPNLGPTSGSGSSPSICSAAANQAATGNPNAPGDTYGVYAVGFDYPAIEAAYPYNLSQTPTIVGPAGQVDITATEPAYFVYN
jgi:hypothetical protein